VSDGQMEEETSGMRKKDISLKNDIYGNVL